jgi:hypothetical protein
MKPTCDIRKCFCDHVAALVYGAMKPPRVGCT